MCTGDVFAVGGGDERLIATMLATLMLLHDRPDLAEACAYARVKTSVAPSSAVSVRVSSARLKLVTRLSRLRKAISCSITPSCGQAIIVEPICPKLTVVPSWL